MKIKKTRIIADLDDDRLVVRLQNPSMREMSEAQAVMDEITDIIYNHQVTLVVINFTKLKHMTSAFISRLITLNKTLKQESVTLRLCGMSPEIQQAFNICNLGKLIPLHRTEDEALKG